jgi:alpha-beta hydrolase superfamily lysophospholipase
MDSRTFNESGDPTVLLVMGLGNRIGGTDEGWLIDRLTGAGYRVRAVQLATDVADFEAEYRIPVQAIHDECDPAAVLAHSLGGLVAAYLDTPARVVYLSPWWGICEAKVSAWEEWLVPKLPTRARILPTKTRREEIGAHLPAADWDRIPERLSPVYLSEIRRAQRERPPISGDAAVFVSLEDTVVSLRAIGAAVRPDRIHLYDGKHQLFSSRGREEAIKTVVAELP